MNEEDSRMDTNGQLEQNLFPQKPDPQDKSISGLFQKMGDVEKDLLKVKNDMRNLKDELEHSEQKRLWLDPKILVPVFFGTITVIGVLLIAFYHVTTRIDMFHGRIDQVWQHFSPKNSEETE